MWAGALSVLVAVLLGARGFSAVLAFGLGGFAAGAAVRQLALATRRQGLRGLVGRTNGGMVVHLGVIMVAVAIAASSSYIRQAEFTLAPGETARFAGHELTYVEPALQQTARTTEIEALVLVNGNGPYAPAITRFDDAGTEVNTPSVRSTPFEDVHLSLIRRPDVDSGAIELRVTVQPLVVWLWIGGGVMAAGSVLALFPGRRRRPTDPVSVIRTAADGRPLGPGPTDRGDGDTDDVDDPEPVGVA
jgi:cytochrome c-type biogenesis protein CcmF